MAGSGKNFETHTVIVPINCRDDHGPIGSHAAAETRLTIWISGFSAAFAVPTGRLRSQGDLLRLKNEGNRIIRLNRGSRSGRK